MSKFSQETIIQYLQTRFNRAIIEINEFDNANTELREQIRAVNLELSRQDDVWFGRLREAERMHKLRTANLERHNKALTDNIIRGEMLRANPPIMILPDYAKYESLQKELERQLYTNNCLTKQVSDLKAHMRAASKLLVKSI